jgi:hypothetical protein
VFASNADNIGYVLIMTAFVTIAAVLYFVPTIVGVVRKHPQMGPIIVVNLLLGWTLIGWAGALALAVSNPRDREVLVINNANGAPPAAAPTTVPLRPPK